VVLGRVVSDSLITFEAERPRLFGLAYRMLGSAADADDVLQDAFVRWQAAERTAVDSTSAFLTTTVTRLCLDRLGSARARRETYVGPWLPEPIRTGEAVDARALSLAFMYLLERLSPAERAAFLLAEVFDYRYAEVATILGKSQDACRQLAARARAQLRAKRPGVVDRQEHQRLLLAFLTTCATGDVAGLERLLASDVSIVSDGGGKVAAARRIVRGANNAARMIIGLMRKAGEGSSIEVILVNGEPAVRFHGKAAALLTVAFSEGAVHTVCIVRSPDKLAALVPVRAVV
jgi:RNA polymerase sigma-70 factor (ECF subfamily)